ncbi:alpha/beta hydrolase family esterase [Pseudoalteromonas sp. G4]|uniref:alpha/beta hydrolase family esterase n=1 Tax=Pseudoalteromonas sp. G4 TaxID=2992761 RepID=UPI00237EDF52|nr:prolyl oligopeptidase family serine peptidase [Pseudoalteromonas sp. G4]MDE3273022.1 prolyl oligopeptidase family serine peptidase [Pseudoalteromonas sp. G4]
MTKITPILLLTTCIISACGGSGSSNVKDPYIEPNNNNALCGARAIPQGANCFNFEGRDNLVFGDTSTNYKGLILTLHGAPGYMAKVAGIFDASMLEEKGYLVISPNGNGSAWQWDSKTNSNTSDDTHYISNLIDYAHANYTINGDKARIFGYSAGGFMAYTLACQIPEKLEGIVSLAGQFRGDFNACTTSTAVAIHHLHSPSDTDVPINGRAYGNIASVEDTLNHWLAINGCASQFEQTNHPAVTASSSGSVTNTWQNCASPVASSKLFSVPHESDYLADNLFVIYQQSMALE